MKRLSPRALARASFALNVLFAAFHLAVGLYAASWWFIVIAEYHLLLGVMRFLLLRYPSFEKKRNIARITGALFLPLSLCLAGTVILCAIRDRGTQYHEIVMITLALYAFTKVTLAIINLIKARAHTAPETRPLRYISLADALVSICSLQRSMLVTFDGLSAGEIRLFNILTGSGVCILIFLFGLNLIGGKRIAMAKSKIITAGEKIAENVQEGYKKIEKGVVDGYKAIEKGVVDGYKAIEKGVVDGYAKLEDKFVDKYLTHEGETVEEAKARLKKEQEANEEKENEDK